MGGRLPNFAGLTPDTHATVAHGTLGFTPEMTTCETVSDSIPDDEWLSEDCLSGFNFPDEVWARVVYDFAVAHHTGVASLDKLVASMIPLYFGRVASLVIETKDMTTDQAEAFIERQARAFELLKPYFVERWNAVSNSPDAEPAMAAR